MWRVLYAAWILNSGFLLLDFDGRQRRPHGIFLDGRGPCAVRSGGTDSKHPLWRTEFSSGYGPNYSLFSPKNQPWFPVSGHFEDKYCRSFEPRAAFSTSIWRSGAETVDQHIYPLIYSIRFVSLTYSILRLPWSSAYTDAEQFGSPIIRNTWIQRGQPINCCSRETRQWCLTFNLLWSIRGKEGSRGFSNVDYMMHAL